METSHHVPLLLIYARLGAGAGGSCLDLPHAKKVVEPPHPKALDIVQVLPSALALQCWLHQCLLKQIILFPHIFGMLLVGQDEGNEMEGLFRVMCSGLAGHSPAPHGPCCSSEGSGTHGKGGTPKLPCSTRLQSGSSEAGPIPDAPISVGMEKAAPDVPSGLQQRV